MTPSRGLPHSRQGHHFGIFDTLQPDPPRPLHPEKPHRAAAIDALAQHAAREYSERCDGDLLWPAQRRRLHGHRRRPDRTARPGLRLDPGHPQRRADRRLAPGHRAGARRRRHHLRPVVARGPRLAHHTAAGRWRTGGAVGHSGTGRERVHRDGARRRRAGRAIHAARLAPR